MSTNEMKELTIPEIRKELFDARIKIEEAKCDKFYSEARIKELSGRDYYEKIELEKDISFDDDIISKYTPIVSKLESLLCDSLANEIIKDKEPVINEEEANLIIDKFSPIVDGYANDKNTDEEIIKSFGELKDEEDYRRYDEAYGDLRENEKKYLKSSKVLNYAQTFIAEKSEKKL